MRLDHRRWAGFWAAFIHAVRNALDHGIERAEERATLGKRQAGTLALRTFEEKDRFVVEISDDGRGIDWSRIAERARSAGLPASTPSDLERALFVDGISTAASVTDVSGRGVGMGALLSATETLGGKLSIESARNKGTTMRFTFPPAALHQ
jgi:two-component system chemotaxis sensor kinase CheA